MARLCPYANKVLVAEGLRWLPDVHEMILSAIDFAKKYFWTNRYDLAFSFKSFNVKWQEQLITYLSGARERVGYVFKSFSIYKDILPKKNPSYSLLTNAALYPKQIIHEVDRNLYLLKAYGLQVDSTGTELYYNYSDLFQAQRLLAGVDNEKTKIVVSLGASVGERKYPVKQYLEAFKKIARTGAIFILIGGPAESKDAKFLQDNLPKNFVLNLVELRLGWAGDVAVMSQLDMYLGNFSGACDAASACRLPVIALIRDAKNRKPICNGVAQYYRFFPWQTNAIVIRPAQPLKECLRYLGKGMMGSSTCYHNDKSHCITQIKPEEIVDAYNKMLEFIKTAKKIGGFSVMRNIKPISATHTVADFKRQKNLPANQMDAQFRGQLNFVIQ